MSSSDFLTELSLVLVAGVALIGLDDAVQIRLRVKCMISESWNVFLLNNCSIYAA